MFDEVIIKAYELIENKVPFVLATVVFTKGMSSAKSGYKALITNDGKIFGWIGGDCISESIKELALECIKKRAPKMVKIKPIGEEFSEEGIEMISNACISNGTIYVYLEPYNVKTTIIVVGDSPVSKFLIKLSNLLDFYTISISKEKNTEANESLDYDSAENIPILNDAYVVIATGMSNTNVLELRLIELFLKKNVRYLAVVASKRRALAIKKLLLKKGYNEELIKKIRTPAGISLGSSLNYKEIALSIISEIVGIVKGGNFMPIQPEEKIESEENFVDPVCGMIVKSNAYKTSYEGVEYRFCSKTCLEKFKLEPIKYLNK